MTSSLLKELMDAERMYAEHQLKITDLQKMNELLLEDIHDMRRQMYREKCAERRKGK